MQKNVLENLSALIDSRCLWSNACCYIDLGFTARSFVLVKGWLYVCERFLLLVYNKKDEIQKMQSVWVSWYEDFTKLRL
jgi:hypothetical protein